jgi:purine-cytosine permease-like protein
MGVIFGFAVGWVSLASDYNVYQPEETPAWKTFAWTYVRLPFRPSTFPSSCRHSFPLLR